MNNAKMNVLFLTKYDNLGASSRYRVYQYLPFLDEANCAYTVQPLFSNQYLQNRYSVHHLPVNQLKQKVSIFLALSRRLFRLQNSFDAYDVIFLQYEALPFFPFLFEKNLFRGRNKIVVDYDDATHVTYEQNRKWLIRKLVGKKISRVVQSSQAVIAGNQHLAHWMKQWNNNVTVIPTSIDIDRYLQPATSLNVEEKPIIGWIGTPVTAQYLKLLEQPLQTLRTQVDFKLRVIGAPDFRMEGIEVEAIPWSAQSEISLLQACTVGVMPLPDEPWARGKSALKLIQYLAAGIAAVASPIGANCDVVQNGKNGFLAGTHEEWVEKLKLLIENPILRQQVAATGQQTAKEHYSIQKNALRLINVLQQVSECRRN